MDPFGDNIFLYGSFILLSLDCLWKLLFLPSFDVSIDHTPCVLDALLQIYNFFSTNYNIYMRELIAAGGRRDSSGHHTTGFSQKYIENAF